jgi:HPr kinase/phosphorylase
MIEHLQLHGTGVAIEGAGILLRGPAGAGKSSLALSLIDDGAILIADDLCEIRQVGDRLIIDLPAAVDPWFRGAIAPRGSGILHRSYFGPAPLVLIVDLRRAGSGGAAPGTMEPGSMELLGLACRRAVLDPFQAGARSALRKMALPVLVD